MVTSTSHCLSSEHSSGITLAHHMRVEDVFLAALLGAQRLPWALGCQGQEVFALEASTHGRNEDLDHRAARGLSCPRGPTEEGGQQESPRSSRDPGIIGLSQHCLVASHLAFPGHWCHTNHSRLRASVHSVLSCLSFLSHPFTLHPPIQTPSILS